MPRLSVAGRPLGGQALRCLGGWLLATSAWAQASGCGSLETHYGPFDYRTDRAKLGVVEQFHFTPGIEALIAGKSGSLESEIDYTLRAFPNHHRALVAITRLADRKKTLRPEALSVDCYYERALRFRMDDLVVRMLFAEHLGKSKRTKEAVDQLKFVQQHPTASPLTQYNVGMVYFSLGRFDEALQQAHLAQSQGVNLPELRDKLKAKGKWTEPVATASAAPAAAGASAPASAPAAAPATKSGS